MVCFCLFLWIKDPSSPVTFAVLTSRSSADKTSARQISRPPKLFRQARRRANQYAPLSLVPRKTASSQIVSQGLAE